MAKNKSKNKRKAVAQEPEEADLGRFAGSSGEEDNDEDEVEEEEVAMKEADLEMEEDEHDVVEKDEEAEEPDEEEAEEEEDDDEVREAASGMANAMARILGTTTSRNKSTPSSVVLSKTTTPLQRQAAQEKVRMKQMREKRRANRERNLTALHMPLSVATSRTTDGGTSGLVQELEMERTHRRVATRGVVALFNAISQHQQQAKEDAMPASKSDANTDTKHMTKHGFLDMIKSAASKDGSSKKKQGKEKTAEDSAPAGSKPQWNALKDDYMMGSKLKDWDKASSEEDDDDDGPVNDNWSDDEAAATKTAAPAAGHTSKNSQKRRKVSSQW